MLLLAMLAFAYDARCRLQAQQPDQQGGVPLLCCANLHATSCGVLHAVMAHNVQWHYQLGIIHW
jgi:hypothetical protein